MRGYYLNQWWSSLLTFICVTQPRRIKHVHSSSAIQSIVTEEYSLGTKCRGLLDTRRKQAIMGTIVTWSSTMITPSVVFKLYSTCPCVQGLGYWGISKLDSLGIVHQSKAPSTKARCEFNSNYNPLQANVCMVDHHFACNSVCWCLRRYIYGIFLHTDTQIMWTHVAKRDNDFTVSIFIVIDIKEFITYSEKCNRRNGRIFKCHLGNLKEFGNQLCSLKEITLM